MLTIFGQANRFCDGVSRRSFLRIGAFGFGATCLTLADIFRAEARAAAVGAPTGSRHKAVINIFLGGGPPHQDMWEIKTEAPSEIKGEFKPINTNVTGIQICEVFKQLSVRMDKCAVIRSVVGAKGGHDAIQCMSGWSAESLRNMGGRPSIGAVLAKVQGPVDPAVPPFVGLAAPTQHRPWSDPGTPGFLGSAYGSFKPDGPGMADLTLKDMSLEQLGDRKALMRSFDGLK